MSGRSGRLTVSPSVVIDESRIGSAIPHPSAEMGGAVAASALAPSVISFARQVKVASAFGGWGGRAGGSVDFAGAPSSGGRGGGSGGWSALAVATAPRASAVIVSVTLITAGIGGAVIGTPDKVLTAQETPMAGQAHP